MTKVIEEYKRFTSDEKLMRAYDARDAFLLGQKMMLNREREEGFEEGMERGIEKGIKKGIEKGKLEGIKEGRHTEQISIAKSMKSKNMDINLISEITGLGIEEIRKLRPDRNKL